MKCWQSLDSRQTAMLFQAEHSGGAAVSALMHDVPKGVMHGGASVIGWPPRPNEIAAVFDS